MRHQVLCGTEVVGGANINPSTVDGELAHPTTSLDKSFEEIGGIVVFTTRDNIEPLPLYMWVFPPNPSHRCPRCGK